MKSHVFSALLVAGVSTFPFIATAETVTPEVVVSATRLPTPANEVGSSVTVITREEIERRHKPTVAELLRDVPGLTVSTAGGEGQTTRVFIRGMESRHTLVMVDGLPVNDPTDVGNAYDFAYLTTDNIERVEILRGPQSALYGADAIGGVISITTLKGKGKPKAAAFAEGGSRHTSRFGAMSSGEAGRLNYSIAGSRYRTGGISTFSDFRGGQERDPHDNVTLSGSVGAAVTELLDVQLTGRYNDAETQFDEFGADTESSTRATQWNGRASGALSLLDGRWKQELGVAGMKIFRDSISSFGNNKYNGNREKLDWVHTLYIAKENVGTLGAETTREAFESDLMEKTSTRVNSLFAQDQWAVTDALHLTLGGRIDHHSTFGTEATWRAAPSYRVEKTGTTLKASYGTGFKAPSLFQLFDPVFGNPALQPEKSRGWDAGFEQSAWNNRITFGFTWFNNDITQLVDFDFATFRYFNTGHVESRGLESFVEVRPLRDTTLRVNHTYTLTRDRSTDAALLRRPKHIFSATADQRFLEGKANASLTLRNVGRREDVDLTFSRITNKSYATLDAAASYQLHENVKLYGRLDNILDRRYEDVYSYGSPGFTAIAGVKAEY